MIDARMLITALSLMSVLLGVSGNANVVIDVGSADIKKIVKIMNASYKIAKQEYDDKKFFTVINSAIKDLSSELAKLDYEEEYNTHSGGRANFVKSNDELLQKQIDQYFQSLIDVGKIKLSMVEAGEKSELINVDNDNYKSLHNDDKEVYNIVSWARNAALWRSNKESWSVMELKEEMENWANNWQLSPIERYYELITRDWRDFDKSKAAVQSIENLINKPLQDTGLSVAPRAKTFMDKFRDIKTDNAGPKHSLVRDNLPDLKQAVSKVLELKLKLDRLMQSRDISLKIFSDSIEVLNMDYEKKYVEVVEKVLNKHFKILDVTDDNKDPANEVRNLLNKTVVEITSKFLTLEKKSKRFDDIYADRLNIHDLEKKLKKNLKDAMNSVNKFKELKLNEEYIVKAIEITANDGKYEGNTYIGTDVKCHVSAIIPEKLAYDSTEFESYLFGFDYGKFSASNTFIFPQARINYKAGDIKVPKISYNSAKEEYLYDLKKKGFTYIEKCSILFGGKDEVIVRLSINNNSILNDGSNRYARI